MSTKPDSSQIKHETGTLKDIADASKPLADYTALRAYTGTATTVRITSTGIAGFFTRDSDVVTADNGGTVIVDASERRWKRLFDGDVHVSWFGAKSTQEVSDFDSTSVFQSAISFVSSILPWSVSPSRGTLTPGIYVAPGVYRISSTLSINFSNFRLTGAGPQSTVIAWYGLDAPVFDIGSFSLTPADAFTGPGNHTFEEVRIQHASPGVSGSRQGQGIRTSGGGGLTLKDFKVLGFKYGINSPYGGDFNSYIKSGAEYCDVGCYQGPGGQQFYTRELDIFACREGLVIDKAGQMQHDLFNCVNCELAGVVFEAFAESATRQLTSIGASGIGMQSQIVFNSPWLEGNAGEMGASFTPTHFFENRNDTAEAYRNITINNPKIVAGSVVEKTTTSYFANTTGTPAQLVRHNNIVFTGEMTRFLTNPQGDVINGYRVETGYTAPAFASGSTAYHVLEVGTRSATMRSEVMGHVNEFVDKDKVQGTRVAYENNGVVVYSFISGGSYIPRFGFDVQNRRLFLDDPAANGFSISRAAAQPTSGTYAAGSFVYNSVPVVVGGKTLLGWQRLTAGSGHVAGTDWVTCYVSNT